MMPGFAIILLVLLLSPLAVRAASLERDPAAMGPIAARNTSPNISNVDRQVLPPGKEGPVNAWYGPGSAPESTQATSDGGSSWPEPAGGRVTGAVQPSVVSIFAQHAARELGAAEMDEMRGGFLLFSSVAMDVRIEFAAKVNGEFVPVMVDPSIFGAPGIFTRLADGVATVAGTNQFRGMVTAVQNNLNFQDLQTATYATFNLTGSMASFRASQFRSELNYSMSSLRR